MQDNTDKWMKMVNDNKEQYCEKINNTNVLHLRQLAAESGVEMTPREVAYYIHIIKKIAEG